MSVKKVYILPCGELWGPRHLSMEGGGDEPTLAPMYAVLFDTDDGWVMLDCGMHFIKGRQIDPVLDVCKWTDDDNILVQLAKINLKPTDIKTMVLSHTHLDHSGYLEYFTEAKIYIHQDEFESVFLNYIKGDYKAMGSVSPNDIPIWINAHLHWEVVPNTTDHFTVVDGIECYNFGHGHTPGMLGLLVDFPKSGPTVLTSDCVYFPENYGPPIIYPGLCVDREGYKEAVEKIRKIVAEKNARIWYGHYPEQYNTWKKVPEWNE